MQPRIFSSLEEFCAFAGDFALRLRPGDVVALSGRLGAGKTTFVRAVVRSLHGIDRASSPTFTFRHRYEGRPPIDHLDLFRIVDSSELRELGLEDAFDGGDSIVLVEWWQKASDLIPRRRYEIDIAGAGDGPRTIAVREPA